MQGHRERPYPTNSEKARLQRETNLTVRQLDTWFANARRRRQTHSRSRKKAGKDISNIATALDHCQSNVIRNNVGPQSSSMHGFEAAAALLEPPGDQRIFHCTFCTEDFATEYNWTRHETSVHLPLKRFICCPTSPVRQDLATGHTMCTYCDARDPSSEHTDSHNHNSCQARPPEARIFTRADHLRQHLRWVHDCDLLPHMDKWLLQAEYVNSRCGFCGDRFARWTARNDHIAMHYRNGCQIDSWKGCRGLDSAVSTQVLAAMPPYLIGVEKQGQRALQSLRTSSGPLPSCAESDGCNGSTVNSRLEILVRELQALVIHYSAQGHSISDQALRDHAWSISPLPKTYTAADSPEWLDLFKRAYCLDILPVRRNLQIAHVADDLEVYHDLGLRIPSTSRHRESALSVLFQSRGPVEKTDLRFSSVAISVLQALPFETLSEPWPDAGVLGSTRITRDRVFSEVIRFQIHHPMRTDHMIGHESHRQVEEDNDLLGLQDISDSAV
jgi:hypothetical protein